MEINFPALYTAPRLRRWRWFGITCALSPWKLPGGENMDREAPLFDAARRSRVVSRAENVFPIQQLPCRGRLQMVQAEGAIRLGHKKAHHKTPRSSEPGITRTQWNTLGPRPMIATTENKKFIGKRAQREEGAGSGVLPRWLCFSFFLPLRSH